MVVIGLIGAALLYGDGTITPAISVLSAIEGIKVYAPQMDRTIVPLTVVILALLFIIQRNGTSWIGGIFGPVMLIWFVVAGVLGIMGIAKAPAVLAALNPLPGCHLSVARRALGLGRDRRRFLGSDRRRGVLCRHGPLRAVSDPHRLVWRGVAWRPSGQNHVCCGSLTDLRARMWAVPLYHRPRHFVRIRLRVVLGVLRPLGDIHLHSIRQPPVSGSIIEHPIRSNLPFLRCGFEPTDSSSTHRKGQMSQRGSP